MTSFLEITVEDTDFFDFSEFSAREHSGVLLDGLGDVELLRRNRETLQGRPKITKGAKSPTMKHAHEFTLCKRAVVATCDLAAANLHLLMQDHWLSDPRNVLTLWLGEPAWVGAAVPPRRPPRDIMSSMSVGEVKAFLQQQDLTGPAAHLAANGVNGNDLLSFNEQQLTEELRCTPFASRKVIAARDRFLQG